MPGHDDVGRDDYSTLAPENSTTFFHFSVSDAMILPNPPGVPPIGDAAELGEPRLDLGDRRAPSLIALLSIAMTSGGVLAGTPMPNQALAS